MKKYMVFHWFLEGGGWTTKDTLEEAKGLWDFGKIVFEIDAEDEADLITYGKQVQSNRLMFEKLNQKYPVVYQENDPPAWMVSK